MTIEKGSAWGSSAPLPAHGITVHSDAEARAVVEQARRANEAIPPLGLLGGDLYKTLGGRPRGRRTAERDVDADIDHLRSAAAMTFPCDLGSVLIDGRIHWFVAHLIARRSWWHGRAVAAMNAQWLGDWDLGPRSHPNDGLLDLSDGDLPLNDRWTARSRARTGTHIPHPAITTSRVAAAQLEFDPALDIRLDGEKVGRASELSLRIEPDALTVVI